MSGKEFLHGECNGGSHIAWWTARCSSPWLGEIKAQIVSESLRPGATLSEAAERHGLKATHLSSWRTMARQGKQVLPVQEGAVEFAAMVVERPMQEPPPVKAVSRIEIVVVGPVTICLEEGASAARIAAIARALGTAT